jgi:hypothetical protein
MAKKATPTDLSSSEFNDETSSEEQQAKSSRRKSNKNSIKNYVTDVLTKHDKDEKQPTDLTQTQIKIGTTSKKYRDYENISAFRQYPSNTEGKSRDNSQRQQGQISSSDDEFRNPTPTEHVKQYLF